MVDGSVSVDGKKLAGEAQAFVADEAKNFATNLKGEITGKISFLERWGVTGLESFVNPILALIDRVLNLVNSSLAPESPTTSAAAAAPPPPADQKPSNDAAARAAAAKAAEGQNPLTVADAAAPGAPTAPAKLKAATAPGKGS